MAKLIFLICVIVALVRENVSKPSSAAEDSMSKLRNCTAIKKTILAASNDTDPGLRGGMAHLICTLERFTIINENITLNSENLNTFASKAFHEEDGSIKVRVEGIRTCADTAVTKVNDTVVNVYAAVVKCMLESGIHFLMSISPDDMP